MLRKLMRLWIPNSRSSRILSWKVEKLDKKFTKLIEMIRSLSNSQDDGRSVFTAADVGEPQHHVSVDSDRVLAGKTKTVVQNMSNENLVPDSDEFEVIKGPDSKVYNTNILINSSMNFFDDTFGGDGHEKTIEKSDLINSVDEVYITDVFFTPSVYPNSVDEVYITEVFFTLSSYRNTWMRCVAPHNSVKSCMLAIGVMLSVYGFRETFMISEVNKPPPLPPEIGNLRELITFMYVQIALCGMRGIVYCARKMFEEMSERKGKMTVLPTNALLAACLDVKKTDTFTEILKELNDANDVPQRFEDVLGSLKATDKREGIDTDSFENYEFDIVQLLIVGKIWSGLLADHVFLMLIPAQKIGSTIGYKAEFIQMIFKETKSCGKILDCPHVTMARAVMISAKENPDATIPSAVKILLQVHTHLIVSVRDSLTQSRGVMSAKFFVGYFTSSSYLLPSIQTNSELADIYSFRMSMIEMVTWDTLDSESKNPSHILKKVPWMLSWHLLTKLRTST